jgi:hypothetical protein
MLPTLELSTRDTMPLSFEFVREKLLNPFMSPPLNQPFDSTSTVVNRLPATFFTPTRSSQKVARPTIQGFSIPVTPLLSLTSQTIEHRVGLTNRRTGSQTKQTSAIISKVLLARKSTQSFLIKYAMNLASL